MNRKKYILVLSFLEVFIISFFLSSNPLYVNLPHTFDQSIFINYGRALKNGGLPFVSIFDNKGPLLFIIEYIGQLLSNNISLFIIELIVLYISLIYINKLILEFIEIKKTIFVSIIFLLPLGRILEYIPGGNTVEEFALPCISFVTYYFIRFVKRKVKHIKCVFFTSGICFSLVFMLKASMVIPIVIPLMSMYLLCVINKKYKETLKYIFITGIGALIPIILMMIYLIKNNIIEESFYQSIIFNISYAKDGVTPKILLATTIKMLFYMSGEFLAPFSLTIMLIKIFNKKCNFIEKIIDLTLIFTFVINFVQIIMAGRMYIHYSITELPVCAAMIGISICYLENKKWYVIKFIAFIFIIFFNMRSLHNIMQRIEWETESYNTNYEIAKIINCHKQNNSTLFSYNQDIYIQTNLFSNSKYYSLPAVDLDSPKFKKITKDIINKFNKKNPTFVVIYKGEIPSQKLNNFLNKKLHKNYHIIGIVHGKQYYTHKNEKVYVFEKN